MNLATRAAFALVLAAGIARSETPAATDWNRVKAVHVGQSIRVLTEDKKHDGVFVRATDTAVELTSNRNDAVIIGRSEVTRISTKSKSHRGRNTAIGTAVGVGLGIAAYATFGRLLRNEGADNTGMIVVVPAAIGAALGAVIPTGRWRTIYQMKP